MDRCGTSSTVTDAPDVDGDSRLESGSVDILLTALNALSLGAASFKSEEEAETSSGSGLMSGKRKLVVPIGENPNRSSSDGHSMSPLNDVDSSGNGMNCSVGLTVEKAIS